MTRSQRRAVRALRRQHDTFDEAKPYVERLLGCAWVRATPDQKRIVRFEFWRGK